MQCMLMIRDNKLPPHNKQKSSIHTCHHNHHEAKQPNQPGQRSYSMKREAAKSTSEQKTGKSQPQPITLDKQTLNT